MNPLRRIDQWSRAHPVRSDILTTLVLFLLLGFFPKPVLDVIDPAVTRTLTYMGVTDPAPTTGAMNGSAQ